MNILADSSILVASAAELSPEITGDARGIFGRVKQKEKTSICLKKSTF